MIPGVTTTLRLPRHRFEDVERGSGTLGVGVESVVDDGYASRCLSSTWSRCSRRLSSAIFGAGLILTRNRPM